jgi:hypothetical protein
VAILFGLLTFSKILKGNPESEFVPSLLLFKYFNFLVLDAYEKFYSLKILAV